MTMFLRESCSRHETIGRRSVSISESTADLCLQLVAIVVCLASVVVPSNK